VDADRILLLADRLGLRASHPYTGSHRWGPHISISCPLAPANHGDPNDYNTSCSISIDEHSPSLARCFSFNCRFRGTLLTLLKQASVLRGKPPLYEEIIKEITPTETFTLEATMARSAKAHQATVEKSRRPKMPKVDPGVLPESTLDPFRNKTCRYALRRGISVDSLKLWELGYDSRQKRLIFPIRRTDGKLIGLSGRDVTGQQEPKYRNRAGLDKARYLYGENLLIGGGEIVVVEGQVDAIMTRQNLGIPTVAPLGEGFSQLHARTLSTYRPTCVLLFPDNDEAGRLAAEKFTHQLHGRMPLKLMMPPPGRDPGDLTPEEARLAHKHATLILGEIQWDQVIEWWDATG
jgi:hypothetical protein